MQDAGSLALITLPDCAYIMLYISVNSTSHLKNKYFKKENPKQFRLTHGN